MPVSSYAIIPFVIDELIQHKPAKILDIGIGNGVYGAIIRNYETTEFDHIIHLEGIEAYPYINSIWRVYDKIHQVELEKFDNPNKLKFDMILFLDVIEHLEEKEGEKQLKRYQAMLSPGGIMIVSTPGSFIAQGAWGGNPYETHRSFWPRDKLAAFGFERIPAHRTLFGENMIIMKYKMSN